MTALQQRAFLLRQEHLHRSLPAYNAKSEREDTAAWELAVRRGKAAEGKARAAAKAERGIPPGSRLRSGRRGT